MNTAKQKMFEKRGWKAGTAEEFPFQCMVPESWIQRHFLNQRAYNGLQFRYVFPTLYREPEFLLEAPGGPEYEHQAPIFLKNSSRLGYSCRSSPRSVFSKVRRVTAFEIGRAHV